MAQRNVSSTRDVGLLTRRAEFSPSTLNAEKRTVQLTWTTGARVKRGGGFFSDPFIEELSLSPKHVRMDRLQSGAAPLLNAHGSRDLEDVIGVVEDATLEKGRGTATVRFDRGEAGEEAFRKVSDGILRNVSVGYRVHKLVKIEESSDGIPVMRAEDWEPYELSMVPIGADAGAGIRTDSERNPCVFVTRQEMTMPDPEETTVTKKTPAVDPTEALIEAARQDREREQAAETVASQRAAEQATAAERKRIAEIYKVCREFDLGDELARSFVEAQTPIEQVNKAILDHLGKRDRKPENQHIGFGTRFEFGEDKGQKFVRGCVASILARSGQASMVEQAKKSRLGHLLQDVATDPAEFGHMRLLDMARAALELRGYSTRTLHGEHLIKRALELRHGDQGFNTTSDFAILLETAMNKIFIGQYALAPVTWPLWAGRKSVNDFRTSTFYRPGTFSVLDALTEAGEVKHKNIPDGEKRTVTPGTKGNIIGITRRALVNDDLGAFQNLAGMLGLAAAFTVEADAFALITANSGLGINYDANPLFHSSRNNIGPTGAMSAATLDGGRAVMLKQKDPSANQYLNMRPAVWLGPVELGGIAKQFNTSVTDPTDNKSAGVTNKVMNLFGTIVDTPYLSAISATRHYLLADPSLYPVFIVAFINGQEAPQMDTIQSFNYDGIQMKVVLDYGTAVIDFRGAVTCAGA